MAWRHLNVCAWRWKGGKDWPGRVAQTLRGRAGGRAGAERRWALTFATAVPTTILPLHLLRNDTCTYGFCISRGTWLCDNRAWPERDGNNGTELASFWILPSKSNGAAIFRTAGARSDRVPNVPSNLLRQRFLPVRSVATVPLQPLPPRRAVKPS